MRILVIGAAGRLGAAVSDVLLLAGHSVIALSRAELDICNARRVITELDRLQPEAIVNCSAYNAVDAAEADPATAFAVNAHGPSFLACAARAAGALLVHYSTDFVFDGDTRQPYAEDEPTNPLSVYGASKLAGENEIRSTRRHYILRLESLFGGTGRKGHQATIDQMTDKLLAGVPLPALADRTVSPSYVADVARATAMLIELKAPHGTYHCVNSGCGDVVRSRERAGPPARRARPRRTRAGGDSEHGRPASAILRAVEPKASPGRCGHANVAVGHRPAPAGTPSARSRRRRESLHLISRA